MGFQGNGSKGATKKNRLCHIHSYQAIRIHNLCFGERRVAQSRNAGPSSKLPWHWVSPEGQVHGQMLCKCNQRTLTRSAATCCLSMRWTWFHDTLWIFMFLSPFWFHRPRISSWLSPLSFLTLPIAAGVVGAYQKISQVTPCSAAFYSNRLMQIENFYPQKN